MASIDGLSSNLDTTAIISQLMAIEKAPQTRLAVRRQAALAQGTTWRQVDTALGALKAAAGKLTSGGLSATASSSSLPSLATITGSATAQTGSHTLVVERLAKTHQVQSATFPSPTATVGAGSLVAAGGLARVGASAVTAVEGAPPATGRYVVEVRDGAVLVNGTAAGVTDNGDGTVDVAGLRFTTPAGALAPGTVTVAVATSTSATTTLSQLASALSGVRGEASAVAVDDGAGSTRLVLSATRTGTANALSVSATGFSGLDSSAFPATDPAALAELDAALVFDGVAVRRGTNTVTDLVPGATITLVKAERGTEVTLAVTDDPTAITASVKGLVDALNAVLRPLATATKYDPATRKGGSLVGDGGARMLAQQLRTAASEAGTASGATLSAIGVALQRDGTYAVNETDLRKALTERPTAVAEVMQSLTTRVTSLVDTARGTQGVVTSGKDGADRLAGSLQRQVDAWDTKLALVEARLRKQFSGLESALSGLQSQGTWLAGQLKTLPTWG